jgi:hypothetical protein
MKSTFWKYLLLCFALILITEIIKTLLNVDQLLYTSLAEKLSSKQIENFFETQHKWQWVSYVFVPIYILIKTSIIASILYIGTFFFSKKEVIYQSLWSIAIKSEFVFLLVPICKVIWFYFFQPNYTIEDIQYFYPLSALNIVGYKGLEAWYIYPFQTINLFELAYWLILAYFLGKATETNMDKGLKIVTYSYGTALLMWMVVIMFFILNYT